MEDLSNRTAVITGGASGIGLALAHHFGAEGMRLVLGDVEEAALVVATKELGDAGYDVVSEVIDVREIDDLKRLEATAIKHFGNVHVLCNNAGVGGGGAVADPDNLATWKWTIDIDLWGVIFGCKVFLPAMIAHGEPCHVVNTASMAGHIAPPMMGAYNVSKFGVVALSETLTREMQMDQTNVGVSVLCPAFVSTGIADSARNMPDDVAAGQTGTSESEDGVQSVIEALVAGGISPDVVAREVVDAIRENRFWILTHEQTAASVLARANEIAEGKNPSLDAIFS